MLKKLFRKIYCYLFFHELELDTYFSKHVQKYKCLRCHKKFGVNNDVKAFIEWDYDLERTTTILYPNHEYHKRNNNYKRF